MERADVGALLSVEQARVGIPAEFREQIFEPFQRGDRHVEHSPGTGIGLSLVRQFAELHGGSAWVDGRDDGGVAFRVLLPTEPGDAQPSESGVAA